MATQSDGTTIGDLFTAIAIVALIGFAVKPRSAEYNPVTFIESLGGALQSAMASTYEQTSVSVKGSSPVYPEAPPATAVPVPGSSPSVNQPLATPPGGVIA